MALASPDIREAFWSRSPESLIRELESSLQGLSTQEASRRLKLFGTNDLLAFRAPGLFRLFAERFKSPLLLILIFVAVVAIVLRDLLDAFIVLGIVVLSAVLSTIQEHRASHAVEKLRSLVASRSKVGRAETVAEIPSSTVVPGDIVLLSAGSLVPADGVVLDALDCYASQAMLTGETFPVLKQPGSVSQDAPLAERSNFVFMGTSIRSGTATMLVVVTGRRTVFGGIAESVFRAERETEFESGLRHFGLLLLRIMILVVLSVLAINIMLQKPTVDTLLFAVALAVGLSPELLPAILAVTLSQGALDMAELGVIVRRLDAIENLGSMDVLCTDKTGTLTRGW
jgi:Mg2+-importing ATPase